MGALALLTEARAAGIVLSLDGDLLVVEGLKRHQELVDRLFENKAAVVEALHEEQNANYSPPIWWLPTALELTKPTTAADWPAAAADFVLFLSPSDLPEAPFEFGGPWHVVVDPKRFLASLQA